MKNRFISKINLFNKFHFSKSSFSLLHKQNKYFSDNPIQAPKKTYGGLRDQDRIFTNFYKDSDPFIEGALKRVK